MKKAIKTPILASAILALSLVFIGCGNAPKETQKPTTDLAITTVKTNEIATYREPLVFIAGSDGSDYYKNAKKYYEDKQFEVITEAFSIQEIINWLNRNFDERLYTDIYIVNKSNPWTGMELETTVRGKKTTSATLKEALLDGNIPKLNEGITSETNIILNASALGDDSDLLNTLKMALSTSENSPKIIASSFYNVFGEKFSPHNLAKPFYVFYPTAKSPGKVDLSKEIANKYPNEKEVVWYDALNNETERFVGDAYTIQFNIPLDWEFVYEGDEEVPFFENTEEIIAWVKDHEEISKTIKSLDIPFEKFRWTSITKKDKLELKAVTTVLCVLKPLIQPYGDLQHIAPEIDNLRLYSIH